KKFDEVKKFCESLGLIVMEMTAEEHDKAMSYSQALTHFIGRTIENMNIHKTKITTRTFDDLIDIVNIIKDDSNELFENIETMNPFAKEVRKKFLDESKKLDDSLNKI
ncbi:prephenate dehydrogenase/arogenate dehydrogenase family protein, partial [Candidatus Pacearchaeota archaeon]|nr:prephenate dehydrogenase/arogenate dehydrogenase family protein [Candidatus Pacearchaeota archaeon]